MPTQWEEQDLTGECFDDQDLSEIQIVNCTFRQCSFLSTDLSEAVSRGSRFIDCKFTSARLNAIHFTDTVATNCSFRGAILFVARLTRCKLLGSDFTDANLGGITIELGDFSYANFRHQEMPSKSLHLRGVKFVGADFYEANLQDVNLRTRI